MSSSILSIPWAKNIKQIYMQIFSFREDDLVKHPCIITPFFVVHAAAGFWLASLIITFFPSLKKTKVKGGDISSVGLKYRL